MLLVEIALILLYVVNLHSIRNGVHILVRAEPSSVVIGVFNDSACKNAVNAINWGSLNPGSLADAVLYLNNTGTDAASLNMTLGNWAPSNISSLLTVTWNKEGFVLKPNTVVSIDLTLQVSFATTFNGTFSFDITLNAESLASRGIIGDLNGDGDIGLDDAVLLALAYASVTPSANWNSKADLNGDGKVDLSDAVSLALNYGSHL